METTNFVPPPIDDERSAENRASMCDLDQENNSDLCEELIRRYGKSGAKRHKHLCASASAMRKVLEKEGLRPTPLSYFAATMSAIQDRINFFSSSSSSNTRKYLRKYFSSPTALTSFLSILLPFIPSQSLPSAKANDAVSVLVSLLKNPEVAQSPATIRSVIKSLGFLIKLCDLERWKFAQSVFEMILEFSIDKRPKVRKYAQVCVEEIYKAVQCTNVVKEASELFGLVFDKYFPFAITIALCVPEITEDSERAEKFKLMESVHMLRVLKRIVQYLSNDVVWKVMSQIHKIMGSKFSLLTRRIFAVLEAILEREEEIIVPEIVIFALGEYASTKENNNPDDIVLPACVLSKRCIDKIYVDADKRSIWVASLHLVFKPIADIVCAGISVSGQAAGVLKELVDRYIDDDLKISASKAAGVLKVVSTSVSEALMHVRQSRALELVCDATKTMLLTNSDGALDENILSVISHMFLKLGQLSYFYLKDVVHELAKLLRIANGDLTRTKCQYLEECFGSAVIAMGAEKILTLLPVVSFEEEELTSLNIWILTILRKYVVGSSLGYYMEHIIPLLQPLQQACSKTGTELQAATCAFWDLLPAFCCYPTDTRIKFDALAKKLLLLMMEDDSMHENVCLALQRLVNQNKSILESNQGIEGSFKHSTTCAINESATESQMVPSHYTMKVAKRNIKALASCSVVLLQALTDVFSNSPLEKRKYLKETIGCLSSITDIIEVKKVFISLLAGELDYQGGNRKVDEQGAQRCVIMEFASALGLGASEDLVYTPPIIFDCITPALLDDGTYCIFFEEHTCFYSSRFVEMMSYLLGLKLSDGIMGLRRRFACLHTLVVYLLKSDSEMICAKASTILKEIILALKDSEKGARKAAYSVLFEISCSLRSLSSPNLESPHVKLLKLISLHLSGAFTTSMTSGAVAALSLLIYNESDICASAPEVVTSVLSLLKSKAKEVIKAASHLQNLLPHMVKGILRSSMSRSHYRKKVRVILEILIRKCGALAVEVEVPEKYMEYFKTVEEQYSRKNSSDKGEGPDVSSTTGKRKRADGELSVEGDETKSGKSNKETPRKDPILYRLIFFSFDFYRITSNRLAIVDQSE
ncbi:hypothetical protein MKW92_020756 [Papaver armeniacum]|nr:hypothetical protein MKW92_020756 [Papaver armeniacum]